MKFVSFLQKLALWYLREDKHFEYQRVKEVMKDLEVNTVPVEIVSEDNQTIEAQSEENGRQGGL